MIRVLCEYCNVNADPSRDVWSVERRTRESLCMARRIWCTGPRYCMSEDCAKSDCCAWHGSKIVHGSQQHEIAEELKRKYGEQTILDRSRPSAWK